MADERKRRDLVAAATTEPSAGSSQGPRFSRRQAIGRMSLVATAGAVAWVAPEILTAKPADGAVMSGAVTADGTLNPSTFPASQTGASTAPPIVTLAESLASTGIDLERDAAVGVALVAGGWVMHHWASRTSGPAVSGAAGSESSGPSSPPE